MPQEMLLALIIQPKTHKAANKLAQQQLPIRTMFKLKGIINAIRSETEKYEQVRAERALYYAEKDEEGKPIVDQVIDSKTGANRQIYKMGEDSALALALECAELAKVCVPLDEISVSELGDKYQLTTEDLLALPFIVLDDT